MTVDRQPLPGVFPFRCGDLVRVTVRGHVRLDRFKRIVWTAKGWGVECILCKGVPLGSVRRREG